MLHVNPGDLEGRSDGHSVEKLLPGRKKERVKRGTMDEDMGQIYLKGINSTYCFGRMLGLYSSQTCVIHHF
jgi:hypothetical protein